MRTKIENVKAALLRLARWRAPAQCPKRGAALCAVGLRRAASRLRGSPRQAQRWAVALERKRRSLKWPSLRRSAEAGAESAPKPPSPLPLFFMLSHLEEDGPVRLDGVKLGVCEVMGLELDEPKLGAFAGALNALDFPAQLLIRQHPPRLGRLREGLQEAQPDTLPPQTRAAAESLGSLLTDLETRDGILDRRFYAVCEHARFDELRGLLARAGLSVHPLNGRRLRMFFVSTALGGTPAEFDENQEVEVAVNRREVRVGDRLVRSLHLASGPAPWPQGFCKG